MRNAECGMRNEKLRMRKQAEGEKRKDEMAKRQRGRVLSLVVPAIVQ